MPNPASAVPDLTWSIYYKVDEVRLDGVRTDQVRAILCGMREEVLPFWMVWEEGTETWRPARTIMPNLRGLETAAPWPALPPAQALAAPTDPSSRGLFEIDPIAAPTSSSKQRGSPRQNQSLEVVLDLNGKLVTTRTVNISLGGMLLETALPHEPKTPFSVVVKKDGEELHMRCRLLPSSEDKPRLFIDHCNKLSLLRSWILSK